MTSYRKGWVMLIAFLIAFTFVAAPHTQDLTTALTQFLTRLREGHIGILNTAPTCDAGCGASPTIAGSDSFFTVVMGVGPSSPYTFTFARAWTVAPSCVGATAKTGMVSGKIPMNLQTSTTALVVTNLSANQVATDIYSFHCGGVQ